MKKIFIFLILGILLISSVSAADWDNKGNFIKDETTSKYGKYEIRNSFLGIPFLQLSKVAELELIENTDICGVECSAIKEITLYEDSSLVNDIIFKTLQEDNTWVEQPIREYSFFILDGENKIPYELGEEVVAGTYTLKLEGQKKPSRTVDWVIKSNGIWTDEWAVWAYSIKFFDIFNDTTVDPAKWSTDIYMGECSFSVGSVTENNVSQIIYADSNPTIQCGFGLAPPYANSQTVDLFDNHSQYVFNFGTITTYGSGEGTGEAKMYIDGNEIWSDTANAVTHTLTNYRLYVRNDGGTVYYNIYNGSSWSGESSETGSYIKFYVTGNHLVSSGHRGYGRIIISNVTAWDYGMVSLNSPADEYISDTYEVEFNCSATVTGGVNITNMSLWTNATGSWEISNTTIVSGTTNESTWDNTYANGDLILWTCQACDSDDDCGFATENYTVSLDTEPPIIEITSPTGTYDYLYEGYNLTLNTTINDTNLDICWYNYNGANNTFPCTTEVLSTEYFNYSKDVNSLTVYANDTLGHLASNFTIWDYKVLQESITYNEISYESVIEGYLINITANSSLTAANLVYDGTSYAGTQSGSVWSKTLTLGNGNIGNNPFYWSFIYGSDIINSSTYYQNVSAITFVLCNATYNTPFLNFTFKDEGDSSVLNASNDLTDVDYWIESSSEAKSYITSNSTEHYDYTFCFSPSDRTVIVDLIFKYSKEGYPLRTFAYDDQELTNTTTNKVLYLLGTIDGIYSSISVIESAGGSIPGVVIQIERQFGGVWTLISQDVTGSDGVATFWVNPNFQHRITATKTNYVTTQVTITPSQTLYTLTMQRTTAEAEYTSDLPGIKWVAYPQSGTIPPGIRSFNITVTSSESNLENCKFELVNATNSSHVLDYVISITNSSYCFLNINYNAQENTKFFGRLSLDTTETTGYVIVNTDWKWIVIDIEVKGWRTITSFFADLTTLSEFGEGNEAEFSKIVTFFLITTIIFGVFIYFSGIELISPGITILLIWGITLFASAGGFLTFSSGSSNVNPVIEQYGFFFIFTIYMINYFMTIIRRANE